MLEAKAMDTPYLALVADEKEAYAKSVYDAKGMLYAAAMAILQNAADAEDAVSEAVLKGWTQRKSLRQPEYFSTWLTKITINTAINIRKRKKRTAPMLTDMPARRARVDERIDIRRALATLDEKTRLAAVLYYFEDMSIAEIARALSIRQGTVKSRLYRARGKLKEVLEGYDHAEK